MWRFAPQSASRDSTGARSDLAGSITMLPTFMVVIGTFIADMLLVLIDPRIRYEAQAG